jgi:alanyl-tRNA synthetase
MTSQELRKKYLEFYEARGHTILPSASLVPENDATTLFTGSGMQPMVPYLLGAAHPKGTRLVDSQKSFRSQDIEEVGDNRHTTFFEMLGNWSLGDYFKQEQIPWMFEFLTKEVGLDPKNIYITVFRGKADIGIQKDEESAKIWEKLFSDAGLDAKIVDFAERDGMQGGRIFYYDESKNWWSRSGITANMPVGEPGGPDSEMFWDYGEHLRLHEQSEFKDQPCHVNCDCGRFLEIGNNVFMEYVKTENGFEKLKQQNVDFGGGLERILAVSSGQQSVFDTDLFNPMFDVLYESLGKDQQLLTNDEVRKARIIADHIRASVFIVNDGIEPTNKDRGYVLRRLLRRSMVNGKLLNLSGHWLEALLGKVISTYAQSYPELVENQERIFSVILAEQKKFGSTLEKGLSYFDKKMPEIEKQVTNQLVTGGITGGPGHEYNDMAKIVFDLYQTYGFPVELAIEQIKSYGYEDRLDEDLLRKEFEAEFKKHKDLSRTASAGDFKGGLKSHEEKVVRLHTVTHLMQAALRKVLGSDLWQKGSNITEERTRFDFTYPSKMTDEQKKEVEKLVNEWIKRDLAVKKEMVPLEEARKRNAIGLFGEKYADIVSIYTMYDKDTGEVISCEFCGGPHVEHTGEISGTFRIAKEEAVSAGVRRVKGVIE